jgi:hypothetical protein
MAIQTAPLSAHRKLSLSHSAMQFAVQLQRRHIRSQLHSTSGSVRKQKNTRCAG